MFAHAEAQRVYCAARESHNELTRNTLKHFTCSHEWWETLKGSIFGVKYSIPALRGPVGGLEVAPAEKGSLLALSLTASSVVSSCHSFVLMPSV